jgi:uncharacterized membrane protein YraQ (UPF0718 family)
MSNKKIHEELEDLHVKSGVLKKAKASTAASTKVEATSKGQPAAEDASRHEMTGDGNEKEIALDLSAQVKELMETLDKELKDTNPVILLGVFALGLFVGRLLPR